MTPENLAVYQELWRTLNAIQACSPWVKQMTAKDRLVLHGGPKIRPGSPAWNGTTLSRAPGSGASRARRHRGCDRAAVGDQASGLATGRHPPLVKRETQTGLRLSRTVPDRERE